jgi:hypothetical protein
VNLSGIVRKKKTAILSSALASSVITLISFSATEASNRVILFVFLEPVALACVMPFLLSHRRDAESHRARILRPIADAAIFCALLAAGAAILAIYTGVVEPLLSTLFLLPFALFVASSTTLFSLLSGLYSGQIAGATLATLIISTPFYVSFILKIVPSTLRLFVAQSAVNVNPIIVASASLLQFDWLRSPRMYSICPIGGDQFPFYYPSWLEVAAGYLLCGLLFAAAAYLLSRKIGRRKERKYGKTCNSDKLQL